MRSKFGETTRDVCGERSECVTDANGGMKRPKNAVNWKSFPGDGRSNANCALSVTRDPMSYGMKFEKAELPASKRKRCESWRLN